MEETRVKLIEIDVNCTIFLIDANVGQHCHGLHIDFNRTVNAQVFLHLLQALSS